MKRDEEIFQSLVVGGLIGAVLGALISKNKSASGVGALAGVAILATFKANEIAHRTNVPVLIEEDNILYKILPNGQKKFIKEIPKSKTPIPSRFRLK